MKRNFFCKCLLAFYLASIWYDENILIKKENSRDNDGEKRLEDRLKMKGFLQEYGNIIVVVAVVLLMLLFSKTGFAKNIQEAILGSTNHIVEKGESITDKETGDILEIEGKKYIVINHIENDKYLLLSKYAVLHKGYQLNERLDGLNKSTYENSDADNYLEHEWYSCLSSTMKAAIQTTDIKQASYSNAPDVKQETGYNGQIYNTISRHAFLPSIEELNTVVDLKNIDKVQDFLNGETIWSRDSYKKNGDCVLCLHSVDGKINIAYAEVQHRIRPSFVIDLSQVDYTEAGHVDYK